MGKDYKFYWQGSRLLPKEELKNAKNYTPLLYEFPMVLRDPANFDSETIKKIREYSSPEKRKNGPSVPPFFFDAIYDSSSKKNIEKLKKSDIIKSQ